MQPAFPILFSGGWWFPGSDLDLDFQQNRAAVYGSPAGPATSQLSITRTTVGYAQDSGGTWYSFASGAFRITDKGLLVEEARTNSIRNNSNTGAVVGTPGTLPTNWNKSGGTGVTVNVIATGTQNGLPYIDLQFVGTTGSTFTDLRLDTSSGIAATNGVAWAESFVGSIVGGSLTNIGSVRLVANQYDSGPSFLSTLTFLNPVNLTATPTLFSGSSTTNNASIAFIGPQLSLFYSSGVAIDITIRISAPQLEVGSFATSPILTTTVAVTRNADLVTVIGAGATIIPVSASAFFQTFGSAGGTAPRLMNLGAAFASLSSPSSISISDGTNNLTNALGSGVTTGTVKAAFGMDNTSMTAVGNSGVKTTQSTSTWSTVVAGQVPYLGNRADSTRSLNGYLQRAAFAIPKGIFDNRTSP